MGKKQNGKKKTVKVAEPEEAVMERGAGPAWNKWRGRAFVEGKGWTNADSLQEPENDAYYLEQIEIFLNSHNRC